MNLKVLFSIPKHALGRDMGLLLLRASFGLILLMKHGLEKITNATQMAQIFQIRFIWALILALR